MMGMLSCGPDGYLLRKQSSRKNIYLMISSPSVKTLQRNLEKENISQWHPPENREERRVCFGVQGMASHPVGKGYWPVPARQWTLGVLSLRTVGLLGVPQWPLCRELSDSSCLNIG